MAEKVAQQKELVEKGYFDICDGLYRKLKESKPDVASTLDSVPIQRECQSEGALDVNPSERLDFDTPESVKTPSY